MLFILYPCLPKHLAHEKTCRNILLSKKRFAPITAISKIDFNGRLRDVSDPWAKGCMKGVYN